MSLNELKATTTAPNTTLKDRSASKEDMDKLKNFISKTTKKEEVPTPEGVGIQTSDKNQNVGKELKEVPEDVLRKFWNKMEGKRPCLKGSPKARP